MFEYSENIKEYSGQLLDTMMFLDIIHNTKLIDTTLWTYDELPLAILVNDRDETVSKKHVLQKLKLADKKKIKYYKKQINKFNSTEAFERDIYHFSRPVFDKTKTFAIIEWIDGHGGLGGGGGVILYKLQNGKQWQEFGTILLWKH